MMREMSERMELIDAIHLIQRFLRKEYIVESCKGERVMGCASCTMTRLHEDLDMLMYEIEEAGIKKREALVAEINQIGALGRADETPEN